MRILSYSEAINEALREEMARDPSVFVMGEDVGVMGGVFGVTAGLLQQFGDARVRDTPISEAGIVGAGLGAAMMGMRPVVEIMFGDFLGCAGDQLINQVAKARYMSGGKARVPLVIRVTTGAPGAAAAQHSQSPESWFMNIPGLKIAVPATPADAKGLLKTAIRGEDPVLFFEHKMLYAARGEVPEGEHLVPFGAARVARSGRDVTLVAIGGMLPKALEAAQQLEGEGVQCEVIDPRTLVPLDTETIVQSVRKTGRVVIAHEAHRRAGPGAEIAAVIAEEALDYLDAPIRRVAAKNVPIPYAPSMEQFVLPSAADIVAAVREVLR
ncbi:MAG: alpha-ketoacid dehydrogenase subunit beta [Thermoflexales bacterium]|nr:alpha-ketoacid dehydrogenase subunit beta [Thermoflexales bacterium]MCS7325640.1 alpha-ketoacid dehydrogenase subunit beta [Thermoflexales bacterium]MCX7939421.1 alpha-ketoacid dehydrogenase subunit beta [Thermoflexales bacterium]MDW8053656.1 alpha-ketoacid dehydrogenase subunit beta [Anaerolineae bacterium]MDW8292491.1 alpha-ketoacid dehydrogenase subunit beta [Anaerolineae bacterium]